MTVETLKGLQLCEELTAPVPNTVNDYIQTNLATGTGPFGTPTVYDFLGTAAGSNVAVWLNQVTDGMTLLNLTNLKAVYDNMLSCVQGTFGPVTGPVTIPSGPGAGVYATGDLAFTTGLIPAAAAQIASIVAANAALTTSLNQSFNNICAQIETEAINQSKAGINYDDPTSAGQQAILSFVSSLPQTSTNNTPGGPVELLTQVADTSVLVGQAILGAIREGNNQAALTEVGINLTGFNVSPDYPGDPNSTGTPEVISANQDLLPISSLGEPLIVPAPVEYQTAANPTSTSYTVPEAQVIAPLPVTDLPSVTSAVPVVVDIINVYEQSSTSLQPGNSSTTLLQLQPFWMQFKAQPSDPNTQVTIRNNVSGQSVTYVPGAMLNSDNGVTIQLPSWFLRDVGTTTLTVTTNASSAADSVNVNVVVNNYPNTTTVTQEGWFSQENVTVAGNTVKVTFRGPPSTSFAWGKNWSNYGTPWPTGTGTFDANGYAIYSGLSSPPVSNSNQVWIRYLSGETVYTSFTTLPA